MDGLWSLGIYQDSLRSAIQKLKYKWVKQIGLELIEILINYWINYQPILLEQIKKDRGMGWVITCVPLHKSRQNFRGFNQSELLAKLLAQKLGLEYQDLLIRRKKTKTQVGLESWQRKQNIKGAFLLNSQPKADHPLDDNSQIILVDDVWTTGSTLKECCYILKRNGAKKVWVLTLAR